MVGAGVTAALVVMLSQTPVTPNETVVVKEPEYIQVEATAYYNKYDCACADGSWPKANHTLAGKKSWLGKECELYDSNYNYLGDYTFTDLGYGKSLGWGESYLHKGSFAGDIECGYTIDIFMNTYSECQAWGRQDVYIVWKEEN